MLPILLSGCMGTLLTRTGGSPIGGYPYQAVGLDVSLVRGSQGAGESLTYIFIITPLDFFLDTALLPLDLITWPFGLWKGDTALYPSP